ncbi:hypothetical protein COV16_00310 [Candidatus Woesearchaeota archaeon CG10_big_fil_rev_8_21_14_0_10_34_8]|nr:MAG: hypothetical protein COV16_00310 [Candidatus Woesearchaeota archaeon CG10_big_fil_rev_8_21_14_0_10_34_8]
MAKKRKKQPKMKVKKMAVCESKCPSMCILRVTVAFVFLYAGVMKLFFGAAPPVDMILTFMPADVSLFLLGMLEFVLGTLLLFGLFTRVTAWVSASLVAVFFLVAAYLHTSGLMTGLWNSAWMWKDLPLLGGSIAIALQGSPCCSIDSWIKKKTGK